MTDWQKTVATWCEKLDKTRLASVSITGMMRTEVLAELDVQDFDGLAEQICEVLEGVQAGADARRTFKLRAYRGDKTALASCSVTVPKTTVDEPTQKETTIHDLVKLMAQFSTSVVGAVERQNKTLVDMTAAQGDASRQVLSHVVEVNKQLSETVRTLMDENQRLTKVSRTLGDDLESALNSADTLESRLKEATDKDKRTATLLEPMVEKIITTLREKNDEKKTNKKQLTNGKTP